METIKELAQTGLRTRVKEKQRRVRRAHQKQATIRPTYDLKKKNLKPLDWRKDYRWAQRGNVGNLIRALIIGAKFGRAKNQKEKQTNHTGNA